VRAHGALISGMPLIYAITQQHKAPTKDLFKNSFPLCPVDIMGKKRVKKR
jgi:hypothetical protein